MSRPWMPLYVADYLGDTRHLTAAQHGAYLLLLMHYWQHGELPDDDQQLARIASMTDDEWRVARPVVRAFFQDGWYNKRLVRELAESAAAYERRSAAGKKRHIAKPPPPQQCSSIDLALHQQSLPQEQEVDGGGGARARDPVVSRETSLISSEAMVIADDLAVIAGHDPRFLPPGFAGAAMRVQAWLNYGWTREVMVAAARGAMSRKADGPPQTVNYFEKPISRMVAQQSAPIATVEENHVAQSSGVQSGAGRRNNQSTILAGFTAALSECSGSRLGPGPAKNLEGDRIPAIAHGHNDPAPVRAVAGRS